jgi:MoxR-like ATPase
MRFRIKETNEEIVCREGLRPILFITSNDERRLPDAFLRRCVSHHIDLTDSLLRDAINAHAGRFPELDKEFIDLAISRFMTIRSRAREKPPATGELLAWLQVLAIETGNDPKVLNADLARLPHLQVLLKTPEGREAIFRG